MERSAKIKKKQKHREGEGRKAEGKLPEMAQSTGETRLYISAVTVLICAISIVPLSAVLTPGKSDDSLNQIRSYSFEAFLKSSAKFINPRPGFEVNVEANLRNTKMSYRNSLK